MGRVSPASPSRRWVVAVIIGIAVTSLCIVRAACPVFAQTSQGESEVKRPAYQIGSAGRFDEDWSVLRGVDLGRTDDFWDRLKFIPLTADQSVWVTLGGQVRERWEYFGQYLRSEERRVGKECRSRWSPDH